MANRLLINMQNKIEVINESLKMLNTLAKGESVTVGKVSGCTEMTFVKSDNWTFEEHCNKVNTLISERENLENRVYHMTKNSA